MGSQSVTDKVKVILSVISNYPFIDTERKKLFCFVIFDRKTSQDGWRNNKRVDEAFREEPSTYENCICSKGVVSTNTRVIRGSWKSVGQQSRMTTQNSFEAARFMVLRVYSFVNPMQPYGNIRKVCSRTGIYGRLRGRIALAAQITRVISTSKTPTEKQKLPTQRCRMILQGWHHNMNINKAMHRV